MVLITRSIPVMFVSHFSRFWCTKSYSHQLYPSCSVLYPNQSFVHFPPIILGLGRMIGIWVRGRPPSQTKKKWCIQVDQARDFPKKVHPNLSGLKLRSCPVCWNESIRREQISSCWDISPLFEKRNRETKHQDSNPRTIGMTWMCLYTLIHLWMTNCAAEKTCMNLQRLKATVIPRPEYDEMRTFNTFLLFWEWETFTMTLLWGGRELSLW